ncbi:MAG: DUF3488 and transglutaminase-like domain-containing protein [Actinomycetota bacterium]|nr:DUF3488 and transglutaminase-like domain-containing protein [Actinomycetota bacterium]
MSPAASSLRTPAELSLIAVTLTCLVGFSRLFTDSSFIGPLAIMALTGHAIAIWARRRSWSLPLAASLAAVAFVLVGTWVFYFHTTRIGLPTSTTVDTALDDLRAAWSVFEEERAPVDPLRGFLTTSALGFWMVAFLSDWSAFRLWAPFEATTPAGGMFVLASLLGAEDDRIILTVLFLAALLGFLLLHRVARQEASTGWIQGDAVRGSRALLRLGALLIVVALAAGVAFGPALPGAEADALVDWRGGRGGSGSRVTLSPLVDIQTRLVQDSEVEAFRVTVDSDSPDPGDRRAYWRLTALDHFDGGVWELERQFEPVEADNDLLDTETPAGYTLTQTFSISGLDQLWLPAAYHPQMVEVPETPESGSVPPPLYDRESATLIVDDEIDSSADFPTYVVESVVPNIDRARLVTAPTPPPEIAERYLQLPDGMDVVRAEAERVAAEAQATTPFERADALQRYFRDPSRFTYDTNVPQGHGGDRVEDFLFPEGGGVSIGYCEQFSSSFAAMARTLGLPARVAVGYTTGELLPEDPNTYVVKGKHSHAWPEVYFSGVGWVAFEPTPGRGAANQEYLNVEEDQVGGADAVATSSTTVLPGDQIPDFSGDLPIPDDFVPDDGTIAAPDDGNLLDNTVVRVLLGIVAVVALYAGAVLGGRWLARFLRRRKADRVPRHRIDLAWIESQDALRIVGVEPNAAETPAEFASRTGRYADIDRHELAELAELTTAARYSPGDPHPDDVDRAKSTAERLGHRVRRSVPFSQRLRHDLDPRRLVTTGNGSAPRDDA